MLYKQVNSSCVSAVRFLRENYNFSEKGGVDMAKESVSFKNRDKFIQMGIAISTMRRLRGMTQEQLAKKVKGCSASDISKAERGEKELTQDQLKAIAKATGVTQKSLIDAARESSQTKPSTPSAASGGKKTESASFKVSAEEKKLIKAYREADAKVKAGGKMMLLGAGSMSASSGGDLVGGLLSGLQDLFKG